MEALPPWPEWFDPAADEPEDDEERETHAAWCYRLMQDNGGWNP